MSIYARTSRGSRGAKGGVRSQNMLRKALAAVIEPLEGRALLSAGDELSSTITDYDAFDRGGAITLLPDGKILQVGFTNGDLFTLTRFTAEGVLDASFTQPMPTLLTDIAAITGVASNASGTVYYVVGTASSADGNNFLIAAFNSDGTFHDDFGGTTGVVVDDFNGPLLSSANEAAAVAIDSAGNVVVGGTRGLPSGSAFAVTRYDAITGERDTTGFAVATNGVASTSFAAGSTDTLRAIAIDSNGTIVAGGATFNATMADTSPAFAIQRYEADGDHVFSATANISGQDNFDGIYGLAIDASGKIVASGRAMDEDALAALLTVARFEADGDLDLTFGGGTGHTNVPVLESEGDDAIIGGTLHDVEIQADGKIVAGGIANMCLDFDPELFTCSAGIDEEVLAVTVVRLNGDGSIDTSFGDGNGVSTSEPFFGSFFTEHRAAISIQGEASVAVGTTFVDDANDFQYVLNRYQLNNVAVVDGTLEVDGDGGGNSISIRPGDNGTTIVTIDGEETVVGPFDDVVVVGGDGDDDIKLNPNVTADVIIFGGAGDDRIKTGSGNDIIVGGDGEDLIHGDGGRDILIGGDGADRIVGNADDDIIVAGLTTHDSDVEALTAIRSEWTSTRSYSARTANILGDNPGGDRANGNFFLRPDTNVNGDATAFDDGERDILTGNQGQDLFYFNNDSGVLDKITDLTASEFAADIDWLMAP